MKIIKGLSESYVLPENSGQVLAVPEKEQALSNTEMARTVQKARSAETGRFIPMKEAEQHPRTTVVEKVKVGPTKHRK
jgi:hypothetical protein